MGRGARLVLYSSNSAENFKFYDRIKECLFSKQRMLGLHKIEVVLLRVVDDEFDTFEEAEVIDLMAVRAERRS